MSLKILFDGYTLKSKEFYRTQSDKFENLEYLESQIKKINNNNSTLKIKNKIDISESSEKIDEIMSIELGSIYVSSLSNGNIENKV